MARRHPVAAGICAVLLWCCAAAASAEDAGGPGEGWRQSVLELHVNGTATGATVVALRDAQGGLWLAEHDLRQLRLRVPKVEPHLADGKRYFPVTALPGARFTIDEARSAANLAVPARDFESSNVALTQPSRPPLSRSGTGVFLNYQLYGQTGQYSGANVASAYTELGLFSPVGVLTNTAVESSTAGSSTFVRLETTLTHDFPDALQTLRLGDAISMPGSWAEAVRFGGLQWGTNYAIRPDLITTPLLAATGTAVVPSTVDVFVNGKEVGSSQVPAGPFVVNQVPALNGSGNVNIVVRNALGQQQVVSVPFYSSPVMLQPGLSLYDIDIGALRDNYGLSSEDYGPLLATATWRHGFSSLFTAEIHAEALHGGPAAAGIDLAQALDHWAVVTADLAAGGQPSGFGQPATSGSYGALGIQHVDERYSVLLETQHASAGFREVGDAGGIPGPRERNIAQAGFSMTRAGNLEAAYVTQTNADDTRQNALSLTYTVNVGRGSISATATRTTGDVHDNSVFVFYTLPLGERRNASVSARYDSQQTAPDAALVASLQQNVPVGVGNGYLLSAGTDGSYDAEYTRQSDSFTVDAGAARFEGQSAERLSFSGGLTYMSGEMFAARTITDSYALVNVGGIPDMTVYFDNQPVAQTDSSGVAIVRDLRSFDVNRLSIDAQQLPLDATVAAAEVQVVPPYRTGTVVSFPVKRVHAGVFRLRRADGSPVPPGATVKFQGEEFPVGFDGLTYVTGYDHGTGGVASWSGGRCTFRLPPPPAGQAQPDLGTIRCESAP
jgi:outer membrane usher protein